MASEVTEQAIDKSIAVIMRKGRKPYTYDIAIVVHYLNIVKMAILENNLTLGYYPKKGL
jgi:hypothetical protein